MSEYSKAAKLTEIEPGKGKCVEVNGKQIALFNLGGTFRAIDNTCIHRGGPLSEGDLNGDKVTCPWHGWEFSVVSGEAVHSPAAKVNAYPVKIDGDDVLVEA